MNENLIKIKNTNIEYNLLPIQFFLLTFWGIWYPKNYSLKRKSINKLIFISVVFLDTVMCAEMIIYFFKSIGTINFKLVNIFLTSATMTGIYKSISIAWSRESLRLLIGKFFNHKSFNFQNFEEELITESSKMQVRCVSFRCFEIKPSKVTIIYAASMAGIFFMNAIAPVLSTSDSVMQLPVDAWYSYPIEKPYFFWLTYLHQVVLGSSLICVHIGIDTLFVGILLKISCQINLLKYRLQNATSLHNNNQKIDYLHAKKKKIIFECINQHHYIYRFGNDLNNKFQDILIIQVITSIPNLCINVYTLSTYSGHIDMDYISTVFNTTSSLIQLFITCWYGNEVSLNSLQVKNAIYNMDWTIFDAQTQKLLLVIMARSSKPLTFSVGYIIPMNLESLITIMKSSYSAFNLLQRTSH